MDLDLDPDREQLLDLGRELCRELHLDLNRGLELHFDPLCEHGADLVLVLEHDRDREHGTDLVVARDLDRDWDRDCVLVLDRDLGLDPVREPLELRTLR